MALNERAEGSPGGLEPTLPELLRSGWRRAGRGARIAAAVAALVTVAATAALFVATLSGGGSFSYEGAQAPPFSLSWDELERVDPEGEELLRLESRDQGELVQRFSVAPLHPAALPSEPSAEFELLPRLALAAEAAADRIASEHPGARVVLEGRALLAVDRGPEAYQLGFVAPPRAAGEAVTVGKRFLVPDPERPGEGVEIEIVERVLRPAVIEKVEQAPAGFFSRWPIQLLLEDAVSVRTEEGLETPLRSFAFEGL